MKKVKAAEEYIKLSLGQIKENKKFIREARLYATKCSENKKYDPIKRKVFSLIVEVCNSILAFFSFSEKAYSLEYDKKKSIFKNLMEVKKNESLNKLNELIEFIKKNDIKDADLEFWEEYKKSLERI